MCIVKAKEQMMTIETATFAGGCFWCVEAVFQGLRGVSLVESGYIGGHVANPTYKQVCGGDTGHAEAIRVTFDASEISYGDLLDIFFATHDPTQLNRQGNDIGTQYRSAIFPHSPEQAAAASAAIERAQPDWPAPIVTSIEDDAIWYPAEDYHQDYWNGEGQRNPYCLAVIPPKLAKLRKGYADRLV
jgi:peptide-methionine (S)-S-oxide reductase